MTDDRWLSDHLLGENEDGEAARRLASDPELSEQARRLEEVVARLAAMPAAAWRSAMPERADGLTAPIAVGDDQSAWTGPRTEHGRRRGLARSRRLSPARRPVADVARAALALALVAIGVGVGALIWSGEPHPSVAGRHGSSPGRAVSLALHPLPGATSSAIGAVRLTSGRQLVVTVRGLPVTGPGHYYELWLMTNVRRLVALGAFRVRAGGRATVRMSLPTAATRYRYFDVSLQSLAAGSAHSRDSVLRGPTARG